MDANRRRAARRAHDADVVIKLLLLGDGAVGKSSLLLRYCEDKFDSRHMITIGVDFKSKVVNIGEEKVRLQIWDTAGQERFRNITPVYFRSAMGVLFVFDVSNLETFENVNYWLESLEDHAAPSLYRVLVGNKVDIVKRQVSKKRAETLAAKHGIDYLETSALDNSGVSELFSHIATKIRHQQIEDITEQARRNRIMTSTIIGHQVQHQPAFRLGDTADGTSTVDADTSELDMISCCGIAVKRKLPKKLSTPPKPPLSGTRRTLPRSNTQRIDDKALMSLPSRVPQLHTDPAIYELQRGGTKSYYSGPRHHTTEDPANGLSRQRTHVDQVRSRLDSMAQDAASVSFAPTGLEQQDYRQRQPQASPAAASPTSSEEFDSEQTQPRRMDPPRVRKAVSKIEASSVPQPSSPRVTETHPVVLNATIVPRPAATATVSIVSQPVTIGTSPVAVESSPTKRKVKKPHRRDAETIDDREVPPETGTE